MKHSRPTTILLLRHAATDWNDEGRWQCLDDRHINEKGKLQARSAAEELASKHLLAPFAALYSSPLARARETAKPIEELTGLPLSISHQLRELDCGELSGLGYSNARLQHPAFFAKLDEDWLDAVYPGGESHRNYWMTAVAPALSSLSKDYPGERVIAVTHGGFIRAASMMVMGIPAVRPARGLSVDNCAYFELELEGTDESGLPLGRAARLNISCHLRRDGLLK